MILRVSVVWEEGECVTMCVVMENHECMHTYV